MKKISKLFIVLASICTMISIMTVQCFAWQNTNQMIHDIVTDGAQSYNITPLKSIYIQTPRGEDASSGFIIRSVQHQNVYNLRGKSNFMGEGYELYLYNTEVQNNWNSIKYGTSDINTRSNVDTKRQYGYLGSRIDDITYPNTFALGNRERGNAYDEFIYITGANLNYERRRMAYYYSFGDFVIDKSILDEPTAFYIRNYYTEYKNIGTRSTVEISYNISLKDDGGVLQNIKVYEIWDKTNEMYNTTVTINGVTYEGYYANYNIFAHIKEHLPTYARDKIQINQLSITVGCNWEDPLDVYADRADLSELHCTYYRPYAEGYKKSDGTTSAPIEPYDETNPIELLSIDYRNRVEWNKGDTGITLNGFDMLGNAVGDTVGGILDTELIPNVTLWTILLIPLSLGIVFAVLRYFAGG